MPPNAARRSQILDAAVEILADTGIGGLTHRQLDARTDLPAGTTSNYFRTRLALLEATAGHVVDLHWRYVAALQHGGPTDRPGVVALLAAMAFPVDEAARRRHIARYELFLEGTRRPELAPFLDELRAAAMTSARAILESAGLTPTDEQLGELSRLLNGLTYSNITFAPRRPGDADPAGLIDRLLGAILR